MFLLLWPSSAICQEFLMATVEGVSHEQLELEVTPAGNPDKLLIVRIAEDNNLPHTNQQTIFPRCVTKGETVRIWGTYIAATTPFFLASDIRGCKHGGCSDPTGVRSRLHKMRKHRCTDSEHKAKKNDQHNSNAQTSGKNGNNTL